MSDTSDDMQFFAELIPDEDEENEIIENGPYYGPGLCPACGSKTRIITTGKHGRFYGLLDIRNVTEHGNLSRGRE